MKSSRSAERCEDNVNSPGKYNPEFLDAITFSAPDETIWIPSLALGPPALLTGKVLQLIWFEKRAKSEIKCLEMDPQGAFTLWFRNIATSPIQIFGEKEKENKFSENC